MHNLRVSVTGRLFFAVSGKVLERHISDCVLSNTRLGQHLFFTCPLGTQWNKCLERTLALALFQQFVQRVAKLNRVGLLAKFSFFPPSSLYTQAAFLLNYLPAVCVMLIRIHNSCIEL